MDNENFRQQFTQNVKAASAPPVAVVESPSRLPFIISIALAAIVLVESIALLVTMTNYFSIANEVELGDEVVTEENYTETNYFFTDEGKLKAFYLVCTSEAGNKFIFNKDNTYTKADSNSSQTGSGNYSITNDSIVSLDGSSDKILYYDGFSIAEGTTLYNCEEVATNETAAE